MMLLLVKYTIVLIAALSLNRFKVGSAAMRHATLAIALFCLPVIYCLERTLPDATTIALPAPTIAWMTLPATGIQTTTANAAATTPLDLMGWLAIGYGLIACAFLVFWLSLAVRTHLRVRRAAPVTVLPGPTGPTEVRSMSGMTSPFAWGVGRRHIVVSAEFKSWNRQKQAMILDHELSHLNRHDVALSILSALWCSIVWFHPLVWWVRRQMLAQAEQACDDSVINNGHDALVYAEELVLIQKSNQNTTHKSNRPQVAPAMASKSDLQVRVRAMLDRNIRRTTMNLKLFIRMCLLALIGLIPVASLGDSDALNRDSTIRSHYFDELKEIHALIEEAQYSTSKSRIDQALAGDLVEGERAQFYNLLGYVHFLERDFDDSIAAYEQVVAAPESIPNGLALTTYYTLAQLSFTQSRYQRALDWIDKWHDVADDPGPIPTIFKAQTLFQMGHLAESLETLNLGLSRARERGHEINPKWIELRDYLESNADGKPGMDLSTATDGGVMLIAKVEPVYPIFAEKRGIEGYVDVRYGVSAEGNVVDARVAAAEPAEIFDSAALSAISKYKYKPRVTGGEAVPTRDLAARIDFRLSE